MEGRTWPVLPWVWTRRQIAREWHIPPPLVDEYPRLEIMTELVLLGLEAEYQ